MGNNSTTRVDRRSFCATASTIAGISLAGCLGGDEDGYPSSDITFIVPFGAGGGYDAYARAIAEHMPAHLPNDVDIAVDNRPGGGSRTGANAIYQADPDGHTIGIADITGLAPFEILGQTDFQMEDFSWFGTVSWEPYGFWTVPDSEYETVEDLQNADRVRLASSGGSSATNAGVIACSEMDINNKNIFGYDGTAESMTAVIRGDADIVPVNGSSARSSYDDGDLRPIVVFGDEGLDWAPEAQAAGELGYQQSVNGGRLWRGLAAPPELDEEILDTLEQAWLDTSEDDDFVAWAEENDRPLRPEGGAETAGVVADAIETYAQFEDIFTETHG